ncbi:MAG: hypothetical protein V5B36_00985 [Candidatus Accumulibacter sp. UW25]|jgi:hypothetical protein
MFNTTTNERELLLAKIYELDKDLCLAAKTITNKKAAISIQPASKDQNLKTYDLAKLQDIYDKLRTNGILITYCMRSDEPFQKGAPSVRKEFEVSLVVVATNHQEPTPLRVVK